MIKRDRTVPVDEHYRVETGDRLHLSYAPDLVDDGEEEVDVTVTEVYADGDFDVEATADYRGDPDDIWTICQWEIKAGQITVTRLAGP